jgi:hypothetical protein
MPVCYEIVRLWRGLERNDRVGKVFASSSPSQELFAVGGPFGPPSLPRNKGRRPRPRLTRHTAQLYPHSFLKSVQFGTVTPLASDVEWCTRLPQAWRGSGPTRPNQLAAGGIDEKCLPKIFDNLCTCRNNSRANANSLYPVRISSR